MPIVLSENFRALFYAPFYAAQATGAFREAGVEVVLKPSPSPPDAARALPSNGRYALGYFADRLIRRRKQRTDPRFELAKPFGMFGPLAANHNHVAGFAHDSQPLRCDLQALHFGPTEKIVAEFRPMPDTSRRQPHRL